LRLGTSENETGLRVESKLSAIAAAAGLSMLEAHRALHQLFDRKLASLDEDVLHIPDCEALNGFLDPRRAAARTRESGAKRGGFV
jgi:hypothetical protein